MGCQHNGVSVVGNPMAAGRSRRHMPPAFLLIAAITTSTVAASAASADQSVAVLLQQLKAQPLGLYDGMRLFRLPQPAGGFLTISVSCEREQWRVQASDSARGRSRFDDTPFLSANGISRTWVCRSAMRVLE